jgi:2-polyprenyl-6-hydroxyphenyl methylase / 3-demethylubiquinone-9 3-methyltransferase
MSEAAAAGRMPDASVDPAEIAKFAALADSWWDPAGKSRPLHRLNPTRLAYIRDRAAARFRRDPLAPGPLAGLRLADIGCGGGLLSEPLTRLGAKVTGIDAGERAIAVAQAHAAESGLEIDYRVGSAESLAAVGERFDIVLAMEIVEHVGDPASFLAAVAALVGPGGLLILATLNRTVKSFALAIIGAEYLLGWVPRGTHDWRRFRRPSELAALLRPQGLELREAIGVAYNPLADKWHLAPGDLEVNYMLCFGRDDV